MPELPEVETVRRGLEPAMQGARILRAEARRPDLRFPLPGNFAARLEGRRIEALSRRAKYLLADLDDGNVLVMHLGMSGSFRVRSEGTETLPGDFHHERSGLAAHDHVVFHVEGDGGRASVTYNDPRRFGFMDLVARRDIDASRHFAGMGIEPLGNALDGGLIARLFDGKAAPLKAALLDQRLIAGLGNIYVCEALWQAGLSPRRSAGSLGAGRRADALSDAIRDVLARAIEAGGSTLRDHRLADGTLGYFQHSFNVYDREGQACRRPGCSGTIRRIVQSGRSTFLCPKCQR
jgi:formamidopyrimidine-DNA glycosylase